MNFLNLTSFLNISHSQASKEKEEPMAIPLALQEAAIAFWKRELSGQLPHMEWPSNLIQTNAYPSGREEYTFTLPYTLNEKIRTYIGKQNIDLSLFLLSALRVLLYRYSRQEDLIIGNPINWEEEIESSSAAKQVFNILPLRIHIQGDQSFQQVLTHAKEVLTKTTTNKNVPYKRVAEAVQPIEKNICDSLFQVLFHCRKVSSKAAFQEKSILVELEANTSPVPDLILEILDQSGHLSCHVDYQAHRFNPNTISRLLCHFECLLEGIIAQDELPVGLLPMLTPAELQQQLIEFNQPEVDYTPDCVHFLFEQQARRTPEAIAVIFDDQYLTYQELNSRANQLAHRLQKYGIGPEVIVGLCMQRSPQLLVGMLGILKAGAAFLPLDPLLPVDRLSFMLEDASPALIVTQEGLSNISLFFQRVPFIYLDRDWTWITQESTADLRTGVKAHNLMYVIYTSGSSGKPKGVLIEHASLTSFLQAYEKVILINEQDRVLQFVPVVFDPMVEDIFCAFHKGATVVLRTEEMADSAEIFFEKCKEWGVTSLNLPAAFWHLLVGELTNSSTLQLPSSIRVVKVGGERLLPEKVDAWKKRFGSFPRLLNAYGPTETTIAATMYDCIGFDTTRVEVPIGHRLTNVKLYVVDNHLQPVPIGVTGELCIGGEALARGYLNRPELESEKFIPDPFSNNPAARMYRTGDLVRYLPDGKVEYLIRLDDQVKIRGYRIELGEIESVLGQFEQIKQAAVVAREGAGGDKRIVAYVIPRAGKIEIPTLRHFLLERLPEYMIPAIFVPLEKLPLTFNGKLDRKALPEPNWSSQHTDRYQAPRTAEEKVLAGIWQNILHIPEAGVRDHFFEIGGYSLLASKLITEIKHTFDVKLPLSWVFAHPTISEQARYLAIAPDQDLWDTLISIRVGGTKPPLYLIHDGFGGVEYGFQLSQFMNKDRAIYGFQAVGLNGTDEPMQNVKIIAEYYINRLLTHQPEGIYHLGAFSGGATIAFEMACQLKAKGKQVGILAIFDSYPLQLNRFTYQRVGMSYVIGSIRNLIFSSSISFGQKVRVVFGGIPQIVQDNLIRIKLRAADRKLNPSISPDKKIFLAMRVSNDAYQFRHYSGSVLFIRAIENPAKYLRNADFGWGRYANQVHVYDLPGDHKSLFRIKETTKTIAGIIDMHLTEYERTKIVYNKISFPINSLQLGQI